MAGARCISAKSCAVLGEGQLLNPKDKASRRQRKIAAARVCKGQGEAEQEQGKMGTSWTKKRSK